MKNGSRECTRHVISKYKFSDLYGCPHCLVLWLSPVCLRNTIHNTAILLLPSVVRKVSINVKCWDGHAYRPQSQSAKMNYFLSARTGHTFLCYEWKNHFVQ